MTGTSEQSPEVHFDAIDRSRSSLANSGAASAGAVLAMAGIIGADLYRSVTQHHFPSVAALWFPACAARLLRPVRGGSHWPLSWDWAFSIYFAVTFAVVLLYEPSRLADWAFLALAALYLLSGLTRLYRRR
jgi:hypothetical protein